MKRKMEKLHLQWLDITLEIRLLTMVMYPEVSAKLMTTTSLLSITERTHIEKREDHAEFTEDDGATWTSLPFDTLVSMNFFGFQPMIMDELEKGFPTFLDQAIKENPLKGEYFIPSVASDLLHDGKASLEVLVSKDQWYGVTYPEDKQSVIELSCFKRKWYLPILIPQKLVIEFD